MTSLNAISLLGWVAFCALAWAVGGFKRPIPWRTVGGSTLLTFGLAAVVFLVPWTRDVLVVVNEAIVAALESSARGAVFLFGPLAISPGEVTPQGEPSIGFVLAAQVLPAVIFFASLMAVFHHWRLVDPVVRLFGRVFHRALGLSGAEALSGSVHIFFGVETAAAVRPYLAGMTRSELLVVLSTNMATVASTTLAVYVIFLRDAFPQIAGHLVSASVLSIPCAVLAAKLVLPEAGAPETAGAVPRMARDEEHSGVMAALAAGAWDGLKIAAGIATILIAVLGVVGVLDAALAKLAELVLSGGDPPTLANALGWAFTPLAWLLGIEAADVGEAARLLGQRIVLTEVVSYQEFGALAEAGRLSPRTIVVVSYALCGFAHIGGMGIAVGGFGALAPDRRDDMADLAFRALAAATLATLLTGALAGVFYHGQEGMLGL